MCGMPEMLIMHILLLARVIRPCTGFIGSLRSP